MTEQAEVDVAGVLAALRDEVRARRAIQGAGEASAALSAIERDLHHAVEQLEITRVVSAHWPLEGKNLYQRGWALLNKVVRRSLKWYIPPIVEQQNAFNDAATRSLRLLVEAHAELGDQLTELRRQIDTAGHADTSPPSGELQPASPTGSESQAVPPSDELQRLVERAGRAEPPAALPELQLRGLPAVLRDRQVVSAHWVLDGDTPLTRARALAQRMIRQYLRWMINPIVEQQNSFNAALSEVVPQLSAADGEVRAQVAATRARHQAIGNRY